MTLYTLENGSYPDENNIFSDWQKKSIFGASLELSIWPQYMAGLDF